MVKHTLDVRRQETLVAEDLINVNVVVAVGIRRVRACRNNGDQGKDADNDGLHFGFAEILIEMLFFCDFIEEWLNVEKIALLETNADYTSFIKCIDRVETR